jgi:ketosteroid isomerase-like protein
VSASSPTDLVRSLYTAINDRDYDAGFSLLSEDFEWLEPEQTLSAATIEALRRSGRRSRSS